MTTFDRIRVLWPDQYGLARGKYLPVRLAERGTGHCVTTFGTQYDKSIIPAPGAALFEGLPDIHASYDPRQVRPGWDDDATGVVVADLAMHGEPFPYAARTRLRAAVEDWRSLGYGVKVGIELEAYVLEPADDGDLDIGGQRWRRWRTPRSFVYGTGRMADPVGLLSEITRRAERSGLPIESINSEFDEGQFELTLEVDDALKAADDAFLFRVLAREVALEMGLDLTFLGKPFAGISGSGVHVNFSLAREDGTNGFDEPDGEAGLAPITFGCLAGLVAHHRALVALCAPTVNAYRRLRPGELCGYWATWGHDHRVAANRVPPQRGGASRIENRVGDGAANIHLAIAAVLQAARLGVVDDLACPPPLVDDGFEIVNTDIGAASDLAGALDDLEADEAFADAVGRDLVDNFVANKRAEWDRYTAAAADSADSGVDTPADAAVSGWEIKEYLPYH